ncbi:uncharacterized protein CCOS01_05734 [Colletotrichum costaricense]|uniref:Uncharacterized protein n=1 Tax=Colletotrichum costaricense TaxID=1209916 RepID=A0AAI9Z275_9PEZI|nr:uncharacterized protein CCOS01_05734 [Colletotrichum costaricense]KAK1530631.1 hypothetical protein CCOS01_05734 [Colletotrichum costaricense]
MPIPLSAREACWRVTGCSSAAHGTTFPPPSRTGTSPCARARGHVMHYQSLKRPQKIPRQIANPMFCLAYGYYVILGGARRELPFPDDMLHLGRFVVHLIIPPIPSRARETAVQNTPTTDDTQITQLRGFPSSEGG